MNCGQEDTLNYRLEVFVTCFVKYVEISIDSHIATATVGNKLKIGEVAAAGFGFLSGGPGTCVKSAVTLYNLMSEDAKKKKSRVVKDVFRFVPKEIRVPIFVEAAGAVFMSYEQIFMAVSGAKNAESCSWTFGIEKLASDAAERFCQQVINDKMLNFSANDIISAVRKGDSKANSLISQVLPNCNYIWCSKPGHTILIKGENGESTEWKTSDVFGKAGVVEITDGGWLEKIYGDKATHYRRRLKWESLEGLGLKDTRTADINAKKYKYKLNMEILRERLQVILEFIFSHNCDLRDFQILKELKELRKTVENLANKIEKTEVSLPSSSEETNMSNAVSDLSIDEIDTNLPKPSPIYITRSISNRLQLDPKIFKEKCPEVFVFKGAERFELAHLVEPHVVRSSSTQIAAITSHHILLESDDDWNDIVAVAEEPIHLVYKEEDEYILQRSTKVTDTILQDSLKNDRKNIAYVSENDFLNQLLSTEDWKGALVCDIPGIGKTYLMGSLARKLQEKEKNLIVLFVQLSIFSKSLAQVPTTPKNDEAIEYMIGYACSSTTASSSLFNHFKKGRKLVIFLDGFDEIPDCYEDHTSLFLKHLNANENIKLIISSRPHMRTKLEKDFSIISYDILPFTREEQVETITRHWLVGDSKQSNQILIDFAGRCIQSLKDILKSDTHGILGVPMECYLLAKVNEKHAKRVLAYGRDNQVHSKCDVATVKSVCELYEMFVDGAIKKALENHELDDVTMMREQILQFHTFKAMELLFPEMPSIYTKPPTPTLVDITRIGILSAAKSPRLEFLHRTFAEYFVGRFFANFWTNTLNFENNIVAQVGTYFLKCVLGMTYQDYFWLSKFEDGCKPYTVIYPILCNFDKTYGYTKFKHDRVIFFVNGFLKTSNDIVDQQESLTKFKRTLSLGLFDSLDFLRMFKLAKCKCLLREKFWPMVLGCIDFGFTNILLLIVELVKVFFDIKDRPNLLLAGPEPVAELYPGILKRCARLSECVPLLKAARMGDPNHAKALFDLFQHSGNRYCNHYLQFCESYPWQYLTPVEMAIATNDLDMFAYLFNKIKIAWERLLIMCLQERDMTDADTRSRTLIFEQIIKENTTRANELTVAFNKYINTRAPKEMTGWIRDDTGRWAEFMFEQGIPLNACPKEYKRCLLENALRISDKHLMSLLILLFGKGEYSLAMPFKAEDVLNSINLEDARETCHSWKSDGIKDSFFTSETSLETLKVLTTISKHLHTFHTTSCEGYLHIYAKEGCLECVKYLIRAGYSVNSKDDNGCTPLHLIPTEKSLEMTRLLIANGANILETNSHKQNVAHCLVKRTLLTDTDYLIKWADYTLEMDPKIYKELWTMKDEIGVTAEMGLEAKLGGDEEVVQAVHTNVNGKSFLDTKRNT